MDRPTTRMEADSPTMRIDLAEAFVPPSRQSTLNLALVSLGLGPILITGDAGIGKSWLVDQLIASAPATRWTRIDITPADAASDLYRQIARGLGLTPSGSAPLSRLDLADVLVDSSASGERYSLVIDEAQNLSLDVWEEVRVLANRLGHADGFANLVLVGQTMLIRRFATRALAAIESRLAAHLHLRPIDLDEARSWLISKHPQLEWSTGEVEAIHRDSGGNPGRLLRRSAAIASRLGSDKTLASAPKRVVSAPRPTEPDPSIAGPKALIDVAPTSLPSLTGADRPPLHFEENAIEVGWSADEVESPAFDEADDRSISTHSGRIEAVSESSDQAVHDHYAALQAWREWAENQDKRAGVAKSDRAIADAIDEAAESEAAEASETVHHDRTSVRVEGQQNFAPFGQLFPRMSQVRESKSPKS